MIVAAGRGLIRVLSGVVVATGWDFVVVVLSGTVVCGCCLAVGAVVTGRGLTEVLSGTVVVVVFVQRFLFVGGLEVTLSVLTGG